MNYPSLEAVIGKTPLIRLQRVGLSTCQANHNVLLGKLEGNNPAGSVKDRPALSMIQRAEERGDIRKGDTLIEATSGNTGIALAMAAAIKGYRMVLIMPEDLSIERAQTMKAYGAELILTPKAGGMEHARDLADAMNQTCAAVAPEVDEFALAGLTPAASRLVGAPRVAQSPVAFECRLTQKLQLQTADGSPIDTWFVFGEVVGVHIDRRLLKNGVYDTAAAAHVVRGGGPADYFLIGPDQLFKMYRPR